MIPEETRTRRELIATVTSGALLGALWGAAFPIVATERRPTVAIIGHRNAQVILIDSSTARVLVLSGEPDDELLEILPAIMTVFRQRIDLLVATPTVLAKHGMHLQERWRIRHAIALGSDGVAPPWSLKTTIVDDALDATLDDNARMSLRIGYRNAWRSDAPTPKSAFWCVTLSTPGGNITIAPNVASISATGPTASALLIVPDVPAPEILAVFPASALAVNYDSDSLRTAPESGPALTRIYPRDVTRIIVARDHFELPEWTAVHEADTGP